MLEPAQAIPLMVQNPNLVGFILFVICFLPLLAYVIKKAESQATRHQDFTNRVMDEAKVREDRMATIINESFPRQTEVLNTINTSLVVLNQTVCDVKGRIEKGEKRVG
jgi:hypothetical protein